MTDVGIVVALGIEAAPIRERLVDAVDLHPEGLRITIGRLGRVRVAVVAGGVGATAARRATRLLIDGHSPGKIVAAGLCGGLDPTLDFGGIVLADSVTTVPSGPCADPPRVRAVGRIPNERVSGYSRPMHRGRIVSTDRVVATIEEKRRLHASTGAAAVDMESWWIAEEAAAGGIEPLVVRVVCDTAGDTIPEDVAMLGGGTGARTVGAAVRLLFRRPSSVFDMAELREKAHAAAETLAAAIDALLRVESEPPESAP